MRCLPERPALDQFFILGRHAQDPARARPKTVFIGFILNLKDELLLLILRLQV
jgi:hypothetical protein